MFQYTSKHTETHTDADLFMYSSFRNDLQVFVYVVVQLLGVLTSALCMHVIFKPRWERLNECKVVDYRFIVDIVLCIPLWLVSIRMHGSVSALLWITQCPTTTLLHPRLCSCIIEGVWQQYTEQHCAVFTMYADGSRSCGCSEVEEI